MRPRRRAQRRAGATRSAQTQYEPALLRGPAPRDLERRETRIRSVSSDSIVRRVAAAGWLVLVLGGGAASQRGWWNAGRVRRRGERLATHRSRPHDEAGRRSDP